MKRLPVNKLSPAAARLLLALQTIEADDTWEETVARAGIDKCCTLIAAQGQLRERGFIISRDGHEYPTLYAQEEERETESLVRNPYAHAVNSMVTKAR